MFFTCSSYGKPRLSVPTDDHRTNFCSALREDMLSAIALSASPCFSHPPCCTMVRVPLLYPNMPKPELEADPIYNADLLSIFNMLTRLTTRILRPICCQDMENASSQLLNMRDATNADLLSDPKSFGSFTAEETRSLTKEQRNIEHRLQSMNPLGDTPESARTSSDYIREAARLGCLIYTNTVLLRNSPQPLSRLIILTSQVINLIESAGKYNVINLPLESPPGPFIWLLCLGGILPLTEEQKTWFAQRIVNVTGQRDTFREFAESEPSSRGVCWNYNLQTSPVRSLWQKVDDIWKMNKDKSAERRSL